MNRSRKNQKGRRTERKNVRRNNGYVDTGNEAKRKRKKGRKGE